MKHKSGKLLQNADALSQLPRPVTTTSDCLPGELVHILHHLSSSCVSASDIKTWTDKDRLLSQVRRYVTFGWSNSEVEKNLAPFKNKQNELSVLGGCVLRGARVIVPLQCQGAVLKELHETHSGSTKMKALARSYVWWPDLDSQIERLVNTCASCQSHAHSPHHYTHGNGQYNHGAVSIWILLVLSWDQCF